MVQKIKNQRSKQDSKAVEQKFAIHRCKEMRVPQHAMNTGRILDWPVIAKRLGMLLAGTILLQALPTS